jgi:MFS family permease
MSKLVDHDSNDTSLFISPAVPSDPSVNQNEFPEGGLASWLVISGAFSLLTASWGMLSVGIFQAHFAANQLRDFTDSQIGWIPGVFVFVSLALGIPVGVLFDRYGSTPLLVFGSICYVARFVALAQCYLYWHFMLCFGVLTGIGAAFMSTTSLSVVPQYFQRRAGLAMGCALSGSGLGGTIFPFALRAGFDNLGWAWTNRLMGLVFGIMCALGICLVKSRLPTREVTRSLNLECFKESRFTLLVIGLFCKQSPLNSPYSKY